MSETSRRAFLSALAAGAAGVAWPATAGAEPNILVLTNATLIDGTGAAPKPNTTIVVVGGRIAAVARHGITPPAGIRVVDLRGKFVLPGLWEMHSHMLGLERILPPLFIANGVTSVREMWGTPFVHSLRDRIASGELLGPRMVIGSNIVDGPDSMLTDLGNPDQVRTEAEARAAVRRAKRDRADFVKLYSFLRQDTFTAAADEARRLGLPIAGHVPDRVSVVLASDLGMRTQEHLYALYVDVSGARDEIRRVIETTPVDPAMPVNWFFMVRELERRAMESYDPRRAAEVFAALARNRTALSPTLNTIGIFWLPPENFLGDPRARYVPTWVRESWDANLLTGGPWTPERIAQGRAFFDASLRLVGTAADAGVPIVPGTDCGFLAPYQFAGFSAHDELHLLVQAGLSPMRAIQSATRDAARVVGLHHTTGTVAPGKSADLLVVDADPLADIRNTQRIHAIVTGGRLITRAERERILAEVEAEAARTPPPPPDIRLAGCPCTHRRVE